jgi:hypothetical protein
MIITRDGEEIARIVPLGRSERTWRAWVRRAGGDPLRSLVAVHLATAQAAGTALTAVITYDRRWPTRPDSWTCECSRRQASAHEPWMAARRPDSTLMIGRSCIHH